MAKTINFGIDLGTTNSVIAKFHEGKVEVFRNPLGMKETLPSVVAFRKNRVVVGDKAREFLEKDPENVVGTFKRKMGTTVKYMIASTGQYVSPVELSAEVLKELKNFVYTGETVDAAVITIPASFDTVQSNATKEAGHLAGFKHVVLLQEPIAASLAYVNKADQTDDLDGQWLVYDLGGGTFDVALVKVMDGEMRVIDHEGNNFLGGADFDALMIEKIVVPYLHTQGNFGDIQREMRSASGKYNKLFFALLNKCEDAKITLSAQTSADVEFEIADDDGEIHDICCTIQRGDFERIIDPWIDQTVDMIHKMLTRNGMEASECRFVLMVGGSTYIPRVRERVGKELGIAVNCNIDPANAVGAGAAFYAGTRIIREEKKQDSSTAAGGSSASSRVQVRMAYQKTSQEDSEFFTARIEGETEGLFYRIIREDGGFDSGLKILRPRIEEDLPLVKNGYNYFRLTIYDALNNVVAGDLDPIGIAQGKFSVTGQPLPNDICLEIDDLESQTTRLESIFKKNEILPLRRTLTKEITRTIKKGADERIIINVLEGPEYAMPSVNQPIGFIAISGLELERDLVKGSDVEITLEISESRDLRISAYLLMTDQEFTNVFTASERKVHLGKLKDDIELLLEKADKDTKKLEEQEQYEDAIKLVNIKDKLQDLKDEIRRLSDDDVTDTRFQLEDRKRKLALELENMSRDQEINDVKLEYFSGKRDCKDVLDRFGTSLERRSFDEITAGEKDMLRTNNKNRIKDAIKRLKDLEYNIHWRTPEYLTFVYYYVEARKDQLKDQNLAENLFRQGREAIRDNEYEKLRVAVSGLVSLLPQRSRGDLLRGTGIG